MLYTLSNVRDELKAIVMEYPGKTNPRDRSQQTSSGCFYNVTLPDGRVGHCIAGQFLADKGIAVPQGENSMAFDRLFEFSPTSEDAWVMKGREDVIFTREAVEYVRSAQRVADTGATWLEALIAAEYEIGKQEGLQFR